MNKSGVFLVVFILLLGIAVVPTGSDFSATQIEQSSSVNAAALASTGTLKVPVAEDTSVVNGSNADTNFDGMGALVTGVVDMGEALAARTWLKFNLANLPLELSISRATVSIFLFSEYTLDDKPFGIYHCSDDTWDVGSITWNNQPTFSTAPSDVIDSPANPDMFVAQSWYTWDVTSDVRGTLNPRDMILTEVLKQVDETGTEQTFKALNDIETYIFNASYLEIEYTTPTTSGLSVDGITSGPLLEYINDPCPDLGWTFSDPDYNDFQKDYDVELWNNTYYNETMLWQSSHEYTSFIHVSGDSTGNYHPFGEPDPFRLQMKFPGSMFTRSGVVDKLYFTTNDAGDLQMEDLEVSLVMVPSTAALTADFNANYEGETPTIVLSRDIFEVSVIDDTIEIDVEDIFFLNEELNLIIEIRLTNNAGDLVRLARTEAGPGSVAANWGDSEASTTSYAPPPRTYDLKIGFLTTDVFKGSMFDHNGFPFDTTVGYPGRFQIKYNQSYISRAGYLDRIFMRGTSFGDVVFENFSLTVVETPVLGPITHGTWVENYGGATATVVLDESMYTVRNVGLGIVIDFDNTFYYSNTHDLLFDIQWDSLVSGSFRILEDTPYESSYRAWDLHYGSPIEGNDVAGYDLLIDFVNNEDSVPLEGCITLIDGTWYYLRARTCDSTGVWGDWTTLPFKYEVISELPSFTDPVAVPDPARVGQEVTVSLNATHSLGIYDVSIEFDGTNHTMSVDVDTFSYTWTPSTAETLNYTIYIRSNANTWSSVEGSFVVMAAGGGFGDMTLILVIGGAAVVVVVILVFVMKKKPAKK